MDENTEAQDPANAGGDSSNPEAPQAEGGGESGHSGPDANALAAQLRKATKQLKQFEQREAERAKLELSEVDRLRAEANEYKQRLEQQQSQFAESQKRNAFTLAAQQAGAVDPNAAWKLADLTGIELDDSGSVQGVDVALKALKKSSPYLFGVAPTSTASSGGNPSAGVPKVTAKKIEAMSPAEYREFRSKVAAGEIQAI